MEDELSKVWKRSRTPNEEKDILLRWYACVYHTYRKNLMFIGRAINKRFIHRTLTVLSRVWKSVAALNQLLEATQFTKFYPPKEVEVFVTSDITAKAHMDPLRGDKWRVNNAHHVKETSDETQSINRKKSSEKFSCEFFVGYFCTFHFV